MLGLNDNLTTCNGDIIIKVENYYYSICAFLNAIMKTPPDSFRLHQAYVIQIAQFPTFLITDKAHSQSEMKHTALFYGIPHKIFKWLIYVGICSCFQISKGFGSIVFKCCNLIRSQIVYRSIRFDTQKFEIFAHRNT